MVRNFSEWSDRHATLRSLSLVVSAKTARNHVSSILTKLGCTRTEAVAQARDAGLGRS